MDRKDYVADRRQYLTDGRRNPTSGGWMVMHWDEARSIYIEGGVYRTKGDAEESLREARQRSDAARALGAGSASKAGSAGRGESKVRGDAAHYRALAAKSAAARKRDK